MIRVYFKQNAFILTCLVIYLAALSFVSFTKSNEAEIDNGIIKATLYLPDTNNGYYRGSRFDWAGIIASLNYKGHSYFGQWFADYSPTNHDAVIGPVESFDPLDYDKVKPGQTFVKIGVGTLDKPDTLPYNILKYYTITNPGSWKVKTKPNEVQFIQTLNDSAYAYEYHKTVTLVKGKPILELTHTLKNTGKRAIETAVFDHNFFMMDKQPTGPGLSVTFPFLLDGIVNKKEDYVKLQDNQLVFIKQLDQHFVSFTDLTGGRGSNKYDLKVEDHNTGAAVRITADRQIAKMVFWSAAKTMCPEPYINIKVAPGQAFTWKITYEYYTCDIVNNP